MKRLEFQFKIFWPLIMGIGILSTSFSTLALAQELTPTPTSETSPTGIYITVSTDEPFANIRMGPSSSIYAKVGVLYPGDTAPALGRSPGGDWIQIIFDAAPDHKGWIYSPLVVVTGGTLQIVEPPPTPIPPPTSTIDPTLAAQFTVYPTNTRLPTFTPAPTIVPTIYTQEAIPNRSEVVPMAVIIMSLGGFGFGTLVLSLFFRRR